MRNLMRVWVAVVAGWTFAWAGVAQAVPIYVGVSGSTDGTAVGITPLPAGELAINLPASTLTAATNFFPNNIDLTLGSQLTFLGDRQSLIVNAPTVATSNLFQFETVQGLFSFATSEVHLEELTLTNPFTDAGFAIVYVGVLRYDGVVPVDVGRSFDDTPGLLAIFFNSPDGSYGNAAFLLLTSPPPTVPEPSTLALCGMGLGLVALQAGRRRRVA